MGWVTSLARSAFGGRSHVRSLVSQDPQSRAHSFAFALAEATVSDAYELERRLGHQPQHYIHRYTNPPEDIAASYVEQR